MSLPILLRNPALVRTLGVRSFSAGRPMAVGLSAATETPMKKTYIDGTVNDPVVFPPPNKAHGSYHWTFERLLSAALVPLVASTAVTSVNPVLDGILAVAIVAHSHIGFDSIVVDYVHVRKFPVIGVIVKWLLRAATTGVLVGVYQFNTNDVGLTELIKRVWKADRPKEVLA